MSGNDCLFCGIAAGKVNADLVYEDDAVVAFRDINPQAPTHVLIIPREHIATLNDVDADNAGVLSRMYLAVGKIARQEGFDEAGYRAVINCNEHGGQTVFHLHLHLLGGRSLSWPPG